MRVGLYSLQLVWPSLRLGGYTASRDAWHLTPASVSHRCDNAAADSRRAVRAPAAGGPTHPASWLVQAVDSRPPPSKVKWFSNSHCRLDNDGRASIYSPENDCLFARIRHRLTYGYMMQLWRTYGPLSRVQSDLSSSWYRRQRSVVLNNIGSLRIGLCNGDISQYYSEISYSTQDSSTTST